MQMFHRRRIKVKSLGIQMYSRILLVYLYLLIFKCENVVVYASPPPQVGKFLRSLCENCSPVALNLNAKPIKIKEKKSVSPHRPFNGVVE